MTHAKFNFNQLMLTLIFGIRASEPPSGQRLKRPGLIGLSFSQIWGGWLFGPQPRKHNCDNMIDWKFDTVNYWHLTIKCTKFELNIYSILGI